MKIGSAIIIRTEKECFQNLEKFENLIMDKLITPLVIHCDETKMKIEKLDIGHLTSNDKYNGIFFIQKENFK
jgi:hypothetical protein